MTEIYIDEEALDDRDLLLKIQNGEVEPHCARCKAALEILPPRDEQKKPLHIVRCPTNPNHFQVHFHQRTKAFEQLVQGWDKDD